MGILKQKQSKLLTEKLRTEIVSGVYQPGDKLPTFSELEQRLDASRGALQMALEPLKSQGFVVARNRQGLYVSAHPPHLWRYGLALPHSPGERRWSRLHDALFKAAHRFTADERDAREIVPLVGLLEPSRQKVLDELSEQIETSQLAGVILTPEVFSLVETEPLNRPDLPKVYLFGDVSKGHIPFVTGPMRDIIVRALRYLLEKGRSRMAVLHMSDVMSHLDGTAFDEAGADYVPQWVQPVSRPDPFTVQKLIPLLFDYPNDQRPDGLIIADDNLVDHSLKALFELGLRPGHDLDIVAHCNWPWLAPSIVPIQRIGFDTSDFLTKCVAIIDSIRAGDEIPEGITVSALFEREVGMELGADGKG